MPEGSEPSDAIGRRFWVHRPDDFNLWVLGTVVRHSKGQVTLRQPTATGIPDEDGPTFTLDEKSFEKAHPATDHDADHGVDCEDLSMLEDPQEWTMLHALRERYKKDNIFTSIGPVLISLNPYKPVSSCKAGNLAKLARRDPDGLPAHVFAIASAAYAGLVESSPGEPQSILVSGESGAGKTETSKLLVSSLALVSSSSGAIVEAALESGLLLEAFGNARTVYNNNSSRFGKWLAVHFDDRGRMASCQLTVYLLEQSRIVKPAAGERNYHIFYHMLAGASASERSAWALLDTPGGYQYTKGEATSPGVDDLALWADTNRRMNGLGFASETQRHVLFRQLAALLALGNLSFKAKATGGGDAMEVEDPKQLQAVAELLQVAPADLAKALTTRTLVVRGDKMSVDLKGAECSDARDSLAMAVYSAIFTHLVDRLNAALDVRRGADGAVNGRSVAAQKGAALAAKGGEAVEDGDLFDPDRSIGILDIFGFENFKVNGFEQLCINFTNERLQQFFIDALIKRERAEYAREGIEFMHIDYPDNTAQVQLIDDRKGGLFALLDDECRAPKGSDANYVAKMHATFEASKNNLYSRPKFGRNALGADLGEEMAKLQFVVSHFAEDVLYTAHGWLEKNRGRLSQDLVDVLTTSESPLLQVITPPAAEEAASGASSRAPTVSGRFRSSLRSLAASLLATHQHFIRCLKPNADKVPGQVQGAYVTRQLRYLGVPAVVEINRRGYGIKMRFEDFVRKYRCVAHDEPKLLSAGLPPSQVAINLLTKVGLSADGLDGYATTKVLQIGKTKLFLKNEVLPRLDQPRRAARAQCAIVVQAFARRRLARRIVAYVRVHAFGFIAVRNVFDRPDADQKAATIEARIGDAGLVLDELIAVHDQLTMPVGLAPVLVRCEQAKDGLELELRALAHALDEEMDAADELNRCAREEGQGKSKDAFMALKAATAKAHAVSRDLTDELREAISKTEAQVEARFAAMVKEWEEEVRLAAERREAERRDRCRTAAADLEREIESDEAAAADAPSGATEHRGKKGQRRSLFAPLGTKATPSAGPAAAPAAGPGAAEPRRASVFTYTQRQDIHSGQKVRQVDALTVTVRNGVDPTSTECAQLVGCSVSLGVHFSELNGVARLVHGGTIARDAVIRVGDVVLAIDGTPCDGRRANEIMDELAKPSYVLTLARPVSVTDEAAEDELPVGEHAGWLHVTRCKLLFVGGLTASGPSHKCWANLQGGVLTLYEERVRGEKRIQTPLQLDGACAKAPPTSKKLSLAKDAANSLAIGKAGVLPAPKLTAAAAAAIKPRTISGEGEAGGKMGKKGKKVHQPLVMQELIDRGLFPFRVSWPDKPKAPILVFAAHTAAERKGWVKALDASIKSIFEAKPTTGYLQKRKGRNGGLFKFGYSKRFFELTQATDLAPPSLVYYETEKKGPKPKGVVVLNQGTVLMQSAGLATKQHEHVFAVSSVEVGATKPITTVLAAEGAAELERWTSAMERALHSFKPKGEKAVSVSNEEAVLLRKTAEQLRLMLEYVGVHMDKGCDDKHVLATEIIRHRRMQLGGSDQAGGYTTSQAKPGELSKNLHRDEVRLMHRDVDELKALLDYMEVEYNHSIEEKHRLVALIINQKRISQAAGTAQRIYRSASSRSLSRSRSKLLDAPVELG